jgi:hypothetical protein
MMTDELWKAKHTKHASLELFSLPLMAVAGKAKQRDESPSDSHML